MDGDQHKRVLILAKKPTGGFSLSHEGAVALEILSFAAGAGAPFLQFRSSSARHNVTFECIFDSPVLVKI